jgi:hypothetical protein
MTRGRAGVEDSADRKQLAMLGIGASRVDEGLGDKIEEGRVADAEESEDDNAIGRNLLALVQPNLSGCLSCPSLFSSTRSHKQANNSVSVSSSCLHLSALCLLVIF